MIILPRTPEAEPNQPLLVDIQRSLLQLPIEYQNLALTELERVANQLKGWLEKSGKQHRPDEATCSNISVEIQRPEESESWLGLALKQSRSGAWKWDLINGTVQWSAELYELLSIDPAEDTSNTQIFVEMIHPDDQKIVKREIDKAIEQGGPFYLEFRILDRDGKSTWLSSAGTVEHDSSGRPIQAAGINQDITARKQIAEELQKSQEREHAKVAELEALMDAVPAIIWISRDPQCKEMVGNRYGYEFLNMWQGANVSKTAPEKDLVQQPYRNLKNGQEIPNHELPMQIAASTGVESSNYEFDIVFINGVTKNLLGNVLPLTDQNGKPYGAVGAFIDITDRKRMEDETRRREAQLQTWKDYISFWGEATSSYFWFLGPDGYYQEQLLTKPRIAAIPSNQAQQWDWLKIYHPEDQEYLREQWQKSIEQQGEIRVEVRIWDETSLQYRWVSHRAVPILEAGILKGWIGASRDIQQRKQAELALRESEHRFRIALASAPMTVFTTDKELRYTWIYNPQHNFTVEQMVGKRDDEVIGPENAKELIQLKQSVLETAQPVRQEIKVKVNGTWVYFVVSFEPILDSRGGVTGLICAAFEITTQRQLEVIQRENEIRMATQQRLLETREDERIKIAREIHDGPLQTLMAMNFDLHNLEAAITDDTLKGEFTLIQGSLKNAVRELRFVVNELRPPTLGQIGLVQAFQEQAEEIRKKFPDLDLTMDLDETVNNLPDQLGLTFYRICQESLHNVLHHSRATEVAIHLSQGNGQVVLVVQDNGVGFSVKNDFTELVADKHYGLAGMKERAEAVSGTFQVISKPGRGTKIKVGIPI